MSRFWVSWIQPTEDYRPLTAPPIKEVLGWWCSGYSNDDAVLCACVDAEDRECAKLTIRQDWPEADEWRFVERREDDFVPSDRFPLSDWMKERFSLSE